MSQTEFYTASGVRLRRRVANDGELNWLLLPGGPGIGSESLQELADTVDVPGSIWLVDLFGDGSNTEFRGAESERARSTEDPYRNWPGVPIEAAEALPSCVYVGHSTGGMYLLSVPELEQRLAGMVLISSAPDTRWRQPFFEMTARHPLPEVDAATQRYESAPTNDNLRDVAVASAEWNFTPRNVALGREFLARMPYNHEAVAWSDREFDAVYSAKWWPRTLPTLILCGAEDHIVQQSLWDDPAFQGPNVLHRTVENAGHFIWLEEPEGVRSAFGEFAARVVAIPSE